MFKIKLIQMTAVLLLLTSASANAALLVTMTDDGNGGVDVTGSGSGFVTGTQSSSDWDYFDFLTNYIVLGNGEIDVLDSSSAFGTLLNVTTGISSTIDGIEIDSDVDSNDDFEFVLEDVIDFTSGDEFSFSLEANFDASILLFSNLIVGTHIHPGGLGDDDIFGQFTLVIDDANANVVNAPRVIAMFAFGFLLARLRKGR